MGEPFDLPVFWIMIIIGFVLFYLVHHFTKRCPKCRKFTLREKGNRVMNFFERVIPPRAEYCEVICENCGFEELRKYPDPND